MATDIVFIYTMNRGVQGGAWSRYVFPWTIEHFAQLETTLYMRHENDVSFVIEGALDDDGVNFDGVIQCLILLGETEAQNTLVSWCIFVERAYRDRGHAELAGDAFGELDIRLIADAAVVRELEIAAFANQWLEA